MTRDGECLGRVGRSESRTGRFFRPPPDEGLGSAFLNQVSVLIKDLPVPGNDASASIGLRLQSFDCGNGVNGVAEDDGPVELPFEDREKCECVHTGCLAREPRRNGQSQEPMSHGPPEGTLLCRRMIDMQWVIISRQASEQNDIRFRHRPSRAFPLLPNCEIIKRTD